MPHTTSRNKKISKRFTLHWPEVNVKKKKTRTSHIGAKRQFKPEYRYIDGKKLPGEKHGVYVWVGKDVTYDGWMKKTTFDKMKK